MYIGYLLVMFSSLVRDTSLPRRFLTQSTGLTGTIFGVPTHYAILGIILIIVFLVIYAVKRMLRRSVRRKMFNTVTEEAISSQQQSSPPQKPCPDCGQSMRFVDQYEKWYCDNCQDYK